MRRILFTVRGYRVYSYPALLYVGLVLGVVVGNARAHAAGLPAGRVYAATLLLLIPALAGARLLFVARRWAEYRREPRRIWQRSEGGMAMYGGLPAAVIPSVPLLRAFNLSFTQFWDVAVFTILVGMAFARIGCLMNGCCAGRQTETWFGLRLPNAQGEWRRRVPMPLLESAWSLMLLAGAFAIWPHRPFDGAVFLLLIGGYTAGRLVLETWREEPGLS
jgi:phosphatidylglycerol:prolipoprotein diacylglycerol transferase